MSSSIRNFICNSNAISTNTKIELTSFETSLSSCSFLLLLLLLLEELSPFFSAMSWPSSEFDGFSLSSCCCCFWGCCLFLALEQPLFKAGTALTGDCDWLLLLLVLLLLLLLLFFGFLFKLSVVVLFVVVFIFKLFVVVAFLLVFLEFCNVCKSFFNCPILRSLVLISSSCVWNDERREKQKIIY